ncbi:BamA/TamA family outer membrane protein [Portibacter lacus]|uniref:POTRA domain-containing protein n=1 Tax=Portibacter lacus TaxID=1099794 RepID=A0AA37SV67_9BACT|nr:BamA/TamA family outer membrane protein [Portibacter lacus]GLR19780.1 hypothetical protein GCM10007940_43960 [Portibacter lacus]
MRQSLIFFFLLFVNVLLSQQITIHNIVITGNKRTKEKVILRELNFKIGTEYTTDTNIEEVEEFNEKRLLSIGLFNEVIIKIKNNTAFINVNENWYIFPNPIFELADQNFNFWWYDQMRDLSRVNYGLRAEHVNLTGHRDKMTLTFQLGYTRKLELKYYFPFLDASGKWTTSINAFYADVREITYKTIGNKPQFATFNDEVMATRFRLGADIGYRPNLFVTHVFRLEYHDNKINPYAASELNPDYFLDGKTRNQFMFFNYAFFFDRREFRIFPEAGDFVHVNLKKEGLFLFKDLNNLSLAVEYEKYFNKESKFIWNYRVKGKYNLIRNQLAYANNEALGGGEVIRGYDRYRVDGSDYFYLQTGVHYKMYEHLFDVSKWIPLTQFNKIDLKLYLSLEADAGYVNERHYIETNTFNNRWLYGYGPSFGLMLYNTYLFQLDYSWNHLGEGGFFVSNKISF